MRSAKRMRVPRYGAPAGPGCTGGRPGTTKGANWSRSAMGSSEAILQRRPAGAVRVGAVQALRTCARGHTGVGRARQAGEVLALGIQQQQVRAT